MSWYQPSGLEIYVTDPVGKGSYLDGLSFREKLKLFFWNRLLWTGLRVRLRGSRLKEWVLK